MSKHTSFYALGLSYKKADATIRGKFSLDAKAKSTILIQAEAEGIESLIVTSTCNRTEIYGFANHPYELIKLLCENSLGTVEEFQEVAYIYKNQEAVNHMFRVGTGLDSQILGDFEIISQLKIAFNESKSNGLVNSFMERLIIRLFRQVKKLKQIRRFLQERLQFHLHQFNTSSKMLLILPTKTSCFSELEKLEETLVKIWLNIPNTSKSR